MVNIDQILNVAIPLILLVVFFSFVYNKFKIPIIDFVGWIKSLFSTGVQKTSEKIGYTRELVYE